MSEVVEAGRRRTTVVGRRRSLSEQTQAASRGLPVKGQAHAEFTRRASGFVRGSLAVRLAAERVGKTRYLVLDCTKCVLSWYRNADDALKNYDEPEGSCLVIGELQRVDVDTFTLITETGEGIELRPTTPSAAGEDIELQRWVVGIAALAEQAVSGYVWVQRRHKSRKRRWAYFQPRSSTITLFKVEARTHLPDWGALRGHAAIEHAVRRRTLAGLEFAFACYAHDHEVFELTVADAGELQRWLDILPLFVSAQDSAGPGAEKRLVFHQLQRKASAHLATPRTPRGGAAATPRSTKALEERIAQLQAQIEASNLTKGKKSSAAASAANAAAATSATAAEATAAPAEAAPPAAAPPAAAAAAEKAAEKEEEEEEESSDDDDEASEGPNAPSSAEPVQVGLEKETVEGHGTPLLSPIERAALGKAMQAEGSGPARGFNSAEEDMLSQLQAELLQLKEENKRMKLQVGGELGDDENEAMLKAFLELLKEVLEMRADGKFVQELFDRYNAAMVQLSDDHLREMYSCFMQVYVDEADDDVYERLGIDVDDVDDTTLGFAEMMSIKLGELVDQPRHVRIQALQAEQQRKKQAEAERQEKLKQQRENAAANAAQMSLNKKVYEALLWTWEMLGKGEGDASEARRFARRPELKLLLMSADEMKVMSAYNWQNMSLGGLKPPELRALAFVLGTRGAAVKPAEKFTAAVQGKLGKMPPEPLQRALCALPPWAQALRGTAEDAAAATALGLPAAPPGGGPPPPPPPPPPRPPGGGPPPPPPPPPPPGGGPGAPPPPPPPPAPPPPPPPPPPGAAPPPPAAPSGGGGGGGGEEENPMFAAIRARKEKQEARMRAIEAGEVQVEDPREARLREQAEKEKAEKAAKRAAKKKKADA